MQWIGTGDNNTIIHVLIRGVVTVYQQVATVVQSRPTSSLTF